MWLQNVWIPNMCGDGAGESSIHIQVRMSYSRMIIIVLFLKEYTHKDYLSFQKKGVGETNILQQIL